MVFYIPVLVFVNANHTAVTASASGVITNRPKQLARHVVLVYRNKWARPSTSHSVRDSNGILLHSFTRMTCGPIWTELNDRGQR